MERPLILPLLQCTDLHLVGGKAYGLARLVAAGFPVPPGICLTAECYRQALTTCGFVQNDAWRKACTLPGNERDAFLADCHARIRQIHSSRLARQWTTALGSLNLPPDTRWAVRSSATTEDIAGASFAGLYRTHLGIAIPQIDDAINDLWASLWQPQVVDYAIRQGRTQVTPAMAVVLQPMVDAQVSGVAYSIHPITGRSCHVAVNAVPGLAEPLVNGKMEPDQYVIAVDADRQPVRVSRRYVASKPQRLAMTNEGLRIDVIPEALQQQPVLSDEQLFELGHTAKRIEQAFGHPVDLEWAIDGRKLWILQARPITGVTPSSELTNDECEWSRANFKETMPELPSPLGLSFLEHFMEAYIIAPYRRLGCRIPDAWTSTRVLYGRPYLNVTLFHSLVAQLRSNPSILSEQMGGDPIRVIPEVRPLAWTAVIRAGLLMLLEMRRATVRGPKWFAEMKALAKRYDHAHVDTMSLEEVENRLDELATWIDAHELTFAIAGGVAQSLQLLGMMLPRWLGSDWRALLNGALQGQGTVISAEQIFRLAEVAEIGRREPASTAFFSAAPWNPSDFRSSLRGTAFLKAFDTFLESYGHRGLGESDIMSPRLADDPQTILTVLRTQIISTAPECKTVLSRQENTRTAALEEIKRRLGPWSIRWILFMWWYRRLCRFFSLREANRHHLMYYSAAARRLLLRLGGLLAARGIFDIPEDVFFLTMEDRAKLLSGGEHDWRTLIRERRLERARHAKIEVPDTIRDWETISCEDAPLKSQDESGTLSGIPISMGTVIGSVRLIRSLSDWGKVTPGDIIVAPVIDPGMAPLFSIAGGLIVEMGGTLSHGAIIAREYGLPTVANVEGALVRLREGQRVRIDAGLGIINREPGS